MWTPLQVQCKRDTVESPEVMFDRQSYREDYTGMHEHSYTRAEKLGTHFELIQAYVTAVM